MQATSHKRRLFLIVTAAIVLADIAMGGYVVLRPKSTPPDSRVQRWNSKSTRLDSRAQQWNDDLVFFAHQFPTEQVDFAKLFPPAKFTEDISDLERDAPRLTDSEIILRLMKAVASGKMSHTLVAPPENLAFHPYPLQFVWYSDGPALTDANEKYKTALGARIVRIGTMTPEQFESAAAPFLSHENRVWLHQISPDFMLTREVADHFGLAKPDGTLDITVAKLGGEPFQIKVAPGATDHMISAYEALNIPDPFFDKNPGDWYWDEYLPKDHAVYIQYNRCRNKPKKPFKDFAAGLFRFVDRSHGAGKVQRIIVDLRFNTGGDSSVIDPLIDGLKSRPWLCAKGHLYVLIGGGTYSSGMMAAVEFRNSLHAVLIGEPSGSPPNEYGEVESFTLPNSKIEIQYTTKFFRLLADSDPETLEPDLIVPTSIADFLSGRDQVLEMALKQR